jgi:UDP-N-acetylmuramyl tripeptide synthase
LNADDPQVASLADATEAGTLYYGLDDLRHGQEGLEHAADSRRCPRCDTDLLYERTFYAHLGHYACGKCGWRRPPVGVSGSRVELSDSDGAELEATTPCGNQLLHVPLGGLYNIYNALAAVAGAYALGVDPVAVEQAVAAATAAFGRLERFQVRGRQVCLIIVKNPTGFNQALRLVLGDGDREIDGLLLALNDNGPDGRDVSWIWDVDFELLAHRPPGRMTLSGTRTHDLALRLKYAGVPTAAPDGEIPALHLDEDVVRAFWSAVGQVPPGGTLYVLPTYTAMWTLRDRLAREGYVKPFWQEARPAARQP